MDDSESKNEFIISVFLPKTSASGFSVLQAFNSMKAKTKKYWCTFFMTLIIILGRSWKAYFEL